MQIVLYYSDKDVKVVERAKKQAKAAGVSMSRLFVDLLLAKQAQEKTK